MSTDYTDVSFGVKRGHWAALEREAARQGLDLVEYIREVMDREVDRILMREALDRYDEPSEVRR